MCTVDIFTVKWRETEQEVSWSVKAQKPLIKFSTRGNICRATAFCCTMEKVGPLTSHNWSGMSFYFLLMALPSHPSRKSFWQMLLLPFVTIDNKTPRSNFSDFWATLGLSFTTMVSLTLDWCSNSSLRSSRSQVELSCSKPTRNVCLKVQLTSP